MPKARFGYTVHMDIHDGKVDAFEKMAATISKAVEETEPGTLIYQWFVSPDRETAVICEWWAGPKGAVDHLQGQALDQHLGGLLETADITNVDIYGTPSDKLEKLLADFPVTGPYEHVDGFSR